MSFQSSLDAGFWIDSETGVLTDISDATNSAALSRAFTILEHVGLGDTETASVQGAGQLASIPLNGFLNSTTHAIYAPIVASGTTITKTAQFKTDDGQYFNGEFNFRNVGITVSSDTIGAWSAELVNQGSINQTSVAL